LTAAVAAGHPDPMSFADSLWTYRCTVRRAVDGDTVDAYIDAGFLNYRLERLRLLGINTPELHAADPAVRATALQAKAFTEQWLAEHQAHGPSDWPFLIRSAKSDAFGRWLADLQCPQEHSLNQALLDAGLAVPFKRR
jgi:endonuclease YncB( thermonuclease family)